MPTRNINLTDELDRLIEDRVSSGLYQNASEVVRAGLRLLDRKERMDEAKLARLQQAVVAGFDALDRRELVELADEDLDVFMEELGERAARAARQAG
jgi:antitoxin ParD1/3/4